jgi:hypothetical protein
MPPGPSPEPQAPSLSVTTYCEDCGAPSRQDLSAYPENLRELVRLYYLSTPEDTFMDARAWTAQRWMMTWVAAEERRRKALGEMRKLLAPPRPCHEQVGYERGRKGREQELAKNPDVKLYSELLKEVKRLTLRRLKRAERRHGKHPFSEIEARVETVRGPDYGLFYKGEVYQNTVPFSPILETQREARLWLQSAELEKFFLGGVTPHTSGRIADCEQQARKVVAWARAQHEEHEEGRRREAAERCASESWPRLPP